MPEDRVPPHSIEAEQSVLGAVLLDKDILINLSVTLQSLHFYRNAHRSIYQCMLDLYMENQPVDLVTVAEKLAQQGKVDDIGGITYLTSLSDVTPVISNAPAYAKIIYDKYLLRQLISAGNEIAAAEIGRAHV